MSRFVREEYIIDGVKTVVYTAGKGEPLVFFHGAGTMDGFDFAEAWISCDCTVSSGMGRVGRRCEFYRFP